MLQKLVVRAVTPTQEKTCGWTRWVEETAKLVSGLETKVGAATESAVIVGRAEDDAVELAISGARLSNGAYRAACCFCLAEGHQDHKTSLVVRADSGRWFCFRCGERGRIRSLGSLEAPLTRPKPSDDPLPVFEPPPFYARLWRSTGRSAEAYRPARQYLEGRGITAEAIEALRMGACAEGPWGGRVIIPHIDADDGRTWRGWVGRVWVKKPREGVLPYRYPPGMRRTIFNAKVLHEETDEPALGFEGALDVAHYHDRAFAFFGSPTESHIQEIERRTKRPVAIVLDGDVPEKNEMLGLRLRFDGYRAGFVKLAPRQDPDEVPRDWLLEEARRCLQ